MLEEEKILGGSVLYDDFWEYDPITDIWNQKANFPTGIDVGRTRSSGFSINDKGYIGSGIENDTIPPWMGFAMHNDFWEYDQSGNLWTQKATLPTSGRQLYVAFSINGKGYIGTGMGGGFGGYPLNDFWEYDPVGDSWAQKASLGIARYSAIGFSLLGKGYIGMGYDTVSYPWIQNDFWEYDPIVDSWTQKASPPDTTGVGSFSIESIGKAYVGISTVFYEYDPATNIWTPRAPSPGPISGITSFSLNGKGYYSCGALIAESNDLWEYTPPTPASVNELSSVSISVYPNPSTGIFAIDGIEKGTIEIYNVAGENVYKKDASTSLSMTVDLSAQPKGVYFVRLATQDGKSFSQKIVKE